MYSHFWTQQELATVDSCTRDQRLALEAIPANRDRIQQNLDAAAALLKKEVQHGEAIAAKSAAEAVRQAQIKAKSAAEKEAFRLAEEAKRATSAQAVIDKAACEKRWVEDKRREGIARAAAKANSTGDDVDLAKQLIDQASRLLD